MFSFYFIGETDLVLDCMKIALSKGHCVLGVVSESKLVLKWAYAQSITVFRSIEQFSESVKANSFDYLFSVVNHQVLNAPILSMPKQLAINYHDAYLPQYAGLYATAWALLNNEKEHGVTWHVMAETVDLGDILVQSKLKIMESDSSYTLNLKCYQKAVKLFSELMDQLTAHQHQFIPQDASHRCYYGRFQRPTNMGFVDWSKDIACIDREIRALSFGAVDNAFLTPKILVNHQYFVPTLSEYCSETLHTTAGKILDISSECIRVSAQNGSLLIKQAQTLAGKNLTPLEIKEVFAIEQGAYLPIVSESMFQQDQPTCQQMTKLAIRHETKLKKYFQEGVARLETTVEHAIYNQIVPLGKIEQYRFFEAMTQFDMPSDRVFISLMLIYLCKINNYQCFHALIDTASVDLKQVGHLPSIVFSNFSLFLAEFDVNTSFQTVFEKIRMHFNEHHSNILFNDTLYRNKNTIKIHALPVILVRERFSDLENALSSYQSGEVIAFEIATHQLFYYSSHHALSGKIYLDSLVSRLNKILQLLKQTPSLLIKNFDLLLSHETPLDKETVAFQLEDAHFILNRLQSVTQRFPDNIAVSSKSQALTYSALDQLSNRVASNIQMMCPSNTSPYIVIHLDDQLAFIVSILGVLKAGFAYVPISHEQPLDRVQMIVDDIMPALIITDQTGLFKKYNTVQFQEVARKQSDHFSRCSVDFDRIAYVIYTSGSTGKPKGVKISHKNIARLFLATDRHYQFTSQDIWSQLHTMSFDFSVWELWGCLLSGGKLVIVPESIKKNPIEMLSFIKEQNISVLNQTPAYFNQLVLLMKASKDNLNQLKQSQVRYIIFGGDQLKPEGVCFWHNNVNDAKLINMYGITEITIHGSYYAIPKPMITSRKAVPIGIPLSDLQFYILDSCGQPIPPGLSGELYILGDGVSPGYHRLPEMTKTRFLSLHLMSRQRRLYRTGDQAVFSPENQCFYFLGRIDTQKKIRGFRIELSEISAVLLKHPSVAEAYSTVKTSHDGQSKIISYIVPSSPSIEFDGLPLNNFLKDQLPHYMIPSFIVPLRQMPLTKNFKVDPSLLPDPSLKKSVFSSLNSTSDITTQMIRSIWEDILGIDTIGLNDNFFELGGHSLLLTDMMLKLSDAFGVDISLQDFILSPTISQIKNILGSGQSILNNKQFIQDVSLYEAIDKPESPVESVNYTSDACLLTGATGFLGIHILKRLLDSPIETIFVLLRKRQAESELLAFQRLKKTFLSYFGIPIDDKRVNPIFGDLTLPNLGLSPKNINTLLASVGFIIHNAACVSHIADYSQLRDANVMSTAFLISLALKKANLSIHYVSSLSAAVEHDFQGGLSEDFLSSLSGTSNLINGYAQSKWVSEMLLSQAKQKGLPVNIYRPSWIIPTHQDMSGFMKQNHLISFLAGCLFLNYMPILQGAIHLISVQSVTDIIVGAIDSPYCSSIVFNCTSPKPILWASLINTMSAHKKDLKLIDYTQWKAICRANVHKENPLYPFLPFYLSQNKPYVLHAPTVTVPHKNLDHLMSYLNLNHSTPQPEDLLKVVIATYPKLLSSNILV